MPVNLHCLMPKKIWELKNKKPIIPSVTKGAHVTLIAAISFNHGVVSY